MTTSYQRLVNEFTGYYGAEKGREIVSAICNRVIDFKCREKYKRETKFKDNETKTTAPAMWTPYFRIQTIVSAEVDKEADEYFEQLCEKYRKPFRKDDVL